MKYDCYENELLELSRINKTNLRNTFLSCICRSLFYLSTLRYDYIEQTALFTVYSSVSFDTCNLCIKPPPQSRYRNFCHSSKFHMSLEVSPSLIPSLQITNNLPCHFRLTCVFHDFNINEITHCTLDFGFFHSA